VTTEGWHGWDDYAPFYDWENSRTVGRADVPFWQRLALKARGQVLELGCGTGRLSVPIARAGVSLIGVDRSGQMLARAQDKARAMRDRPSGRRRARLALVRADIRALPFPAGRFSLVLAPYGVLQSLIRPRDLSAALASVARVIEPGGMFALDLVRDVPQWDEYKDRVTFRGRARGGTHLTLIESVRQDRRRNLTIFEQRFVERRGRRAAEHRFYLTFRTVPMRRMVQLVERAGFSVETLLGDYRGHPWDERADVWILLARKL
jgi:ubiquinone/menaquinone biosynthesis C-methylase UbiE